MAPKDPLKKLRAENPESDEILGRLMALQTEPDYVAAIVAPSLVEHTLQLALLAKFVPLSESQQNALFIDAQNGVLSSLGVKNRIAHAIGLYGQSTFSDLDRLRSVRNTFAHTKMAIKFDTPEVAAVCRQFELLPRHYLPETLAETAPKQLFLWATTHLHLAIYSTWHHHLVKAVEQAVPDAPPLP